MRLTKLYLRIWLAVVLTVAVLTLLVGWAWRMAAEPPLREVVIRDETGEVVGRGHSRLRPQEGEHAEHMHGEPDPQASVFGPRGRFGSGPEYVVRMEDGQLIHLHLPRPPQSPWHRPPFGFFWMLAMVAVAVALATYPIVRKLTRRLETLQNGVERWGAGELSLRVSEAGQDEVAFLAARFNHAAEQIETLVKSHESLLASQKSLLANASHELRSPLARIRMGLELMGAPSSPVFKAEIARNIAELDGLIEEILLASRLDAREADMGTVESVDLIGLAAEECAHINADLVVEPGAPAVPGLPAPSLQVQGVTKLLRRVMRNLLENARRYAATGIEVSLQATPGWAEMRVSDRGPGVPAHLRERIFEPFYRLPGATERDGGVGLGLALVKSITERHGGSVACQERPGGGACFVIRLPASPDGAA